MIIISLLCGFQQAAKSANIGQNLKKFTELWITGNSATDADFSKHEVSCLERIENKDVEAETGSGKFSWKQ